MEKEKDNDTSSAAAKSKSRAPRSRTAVFVVLGLIAMIVYAGSVALISLTLVPAWLPWTVAAIIAVATGLWGRKAMGRMCGISAMWLNYLIYVVIATGLFAFALLLANRLGAGECEPVQAEVTRVYSETRYHSKRVSSRRYIRGDPYKVYYIDVCLEGGINKPVSVNVNTFRKMRKGCYVELALRSGALGFKVIDSKGMHLVESKQPQKRNYSADAPM